MKAKQGGKSAEGESAEQINFNELQLKKKIGEGSFGVVYEGSYKGNVVAIKEVIFKHIKASYINIQTYYYLLLFYVYRQKGLTLSRSETSFRGNARCSHSSAARTS